MRRDTFVLFGAAVGLAATAGMILRSGAPGPIGEAHLAADAQPEAGAFVLGHTMNDLAGEPQDLSQYLGKVILIVNTASKCGLTPQYEGLQTLFERYEDQGFVVLGFPANNFRNQEPLSDGQIAEFCTQNYGVTFPMFSKISVGGDDQCALYKQLTTQPAPIGGPVKWNFQKYLVDREGNVVAMFDPAVKPDDQRLTVEIERLLGHTPAS